MNRFPKHKDVAMSIVHTDNQTYTMSHLIHFHKRQQTLRSASHPYQTFTLWHCKKSLEVTHTWFVCFWSESLLMTFGYVYLFNILRLSLTLVHDPFVLMKLYWLRTGFELCTIYTVTRDHSDQCTDFSRQLQTNYPLF